MTGSDWLYGGLYSNQLTNSINGLADALNQYQRVLQLVQPQNRQSFSEVFQKASHNLEVPANLKPYFEEAAEKYQVPVQLLEAIGYEESRFQTNATSKKGAMGVMQLMPLTARHFGVTNAYDPRSNIMAGAQYLSECFEEFDGNLELGLAAYGAGAGAVKKYGGVPPYKETQNYIKMVKELLGLDQQDHNILVSELMSDTPTVYDFNALRGTSDIQSSNLPLTPQFSQRDADFFVQMMQLQMQERMLSATQSMFNFDEV